MLTSECEAEFGEDETLFVPKSPHVCATRRPQAATIVQIPRFLEEPLNGRVVQSPLIETNSDLRHKEKLVLQP